MQTLLTSHRRAASGSALLATLRGVTVRPLLCDHQAPPGSGLEVANALHRILKLIKPLA